MKTKCAPAPLTMQEVFTMDKNYWENPVALRLPHLGLRTVENTYDAAAYLMEEWPVDHGEAYDRAIRMCLLSIRGKKQPTTARRAFIDAANEAHIHINVAA
jgi:hypothetical protein